MYADSTSSAAMAIKNELYSSLWASCDTLRGSMGKDEYILQIIIAVFT